MVVSYEELLVNPSRFIQNFLDVAPFLNPSEVQVDQAVRSVRPEWRVNDNGEGELSEWPEIVRETLSLSRRSAMDIQGFADGRYDEEIEALWIKWRRMRLMVKTEAIPRGTLALGEDVPGGQAVGTEYQPTGTWQTVVAPVPRTEQLHLLVEVYQLPAVIWIRKAVVKGEGQEEEAKLSATAHGSLSYSHGCFRLVQWGWSPLALRLPRGFKAEVLELELYIQWNVYAVEDVVNALRNSKLR